MLPHPYGKCAEDGEEQLKYFEGSYTKSKCLIECERDFMVRKCGCITYYMPGIALLLWFYDYLALLF